MMKVVNFFLSMIIILVDKYHFRCNLAIGNGIKKFITISVVYYNFGCHFSTEIVITEIVIKKLLQFRSVITISVGYYKLALWYIKTKSYTKFELNMSKHVGEKCGKLHICKNLKLKRSITPAKSDGN